MKKIAIWGDSVLKGVVLEEGKDRYSLLKDSSIELIKREYDLMIKNNSKFGLTVTKAMRLMDKSLSKGDHPNYVLVELGGNDCDYNWKEISENPDKEYYPNTPLPKFIESIKVLSVRDSSGNDVFSDSQTERSSGELLFAVKDNLFMLLSEASFVGGIEIVPVPRNATYRNEGDTENGTQVSKQELVDFILAKVSELSDQVDVATAITDSDNAASNTTGN